MNKKILATVSATILTITSVTAFASAAYYSQDGYYYGNRSIGESVEYANAHSHYSRKGWGWSYETKNVYRGQYDAGTLYAYYNPEMSGNEKAYAFEEADLYNVSLDCLVNSNGVTSWSAHTYGGTTQTDTISVSNGASVKWRHTAYWY